MAKCGLVVDKSDIVSQTRAAQLRENVECHPLHRDIQRDYIPRESLSSDLKSPLTPTQYNVSLGVDGSCLKLPYP